MKNIETDNRALYADVIKMMWANQVKNPNIDVDNINTVGIEHHFIKWLIVADNDEAAVRIAQKPEMLRTNAELHNLVTATHYDAFVQNLYEVCPEYLDGEDEIAFYRKRIEHEQDQPWLNTLRALKIE